MSMVKTVINTTNNNKTYFRLSPQTIVNKKRPQHWYVDENECPGLGQSRKYGGVEPNWFQLFNNLISVITDINKQ
jgi:hypothetical protein